MGWDGRHWEIMTAVIGMAVIGMAVIGGAAAKVRQQRCGSKGSNMGVERNPNYNRKHVCTAIAAAI